MKRLLLRMSVLGTVIALGLIAIAQAQRSSEPAASPHPAAPATRSGPLGVAGPAGNPLRLPAARASSDIRDSAVRTAEATEPAPTRAAQTFSLAAATDTGLAPPTTASETAVATPPPLDFGFPAPLDFGTPPPGQATGPSLANVQPIPAAAQPGPAAGGSAREPLLRQADAMPPLDVNRATGQLPPGTYSTDADPVPKQLEAPEAQPIHRAFEPSALAGATAQAAFSGPQTATGTGRPGGKNLEGAQAPQLVIEKIAPAEIQVGRPAIFEIRVRNVGTVAAANVEIRDEIPEGTRLESTKPQASQGAQGGLVWKIGTLTPNQEATVEMELMPTEEGEIGSVATVQFHAEASVRTKATRPLLAVETEAVDKVLKGEELNLKIIVSNPGTGIAENVVLEEHVPPGFRHPAGAELEYEVGNLAPNESRELTLVLEAVHPGPLVNVITARGEPSLRTENQRPVEVIAPQLEVAVEGPARRFLECEAVYNVSVRNPGTAPAKQVELAVEVPAGMKFVSGTNQAFYQEATRTVHWMLEEIPVQDGPPPVQLTLMPVEAGEHRIRLVSSDDSGAKAEVEQAVHVEGIVAMSFEVADLQDPIEVGGQTLYEIRVVNQGSKEATNVRLAAELPPGLKAVAVEGPTQQAQAAQGNIVVFQPLPRLAAKADVTYRIRVEGVQPGDLRMRVQVTTDEIETPITKEESTRVYSAQ